MGEDTYSRSRGGGPDRLIGRALAGRFLVQELVTRGAMGKIYKGIQLDPERECAIKVLDLRHVQGPTSEFTTRFFREASVAAKIAHPNVVTVFDYGRTDDDVYFIAMELLHGRSIEQALRAEKRFPWQRAVEIACEMCRGLGAAHALDVVHRDLKPANVYLVDAEGGENSRVKILDFGIAKLLRPAPGDDQQLTQIGAFMGSAKYACPEQIEARTGVDGRADIYAMGVMLHEMIAGQVPFDGPNEASVLVAHMRGTPAPLRAAAPDAHVPEALERVVLRCMSRAREGRYGTVADLLHALRGTLPATAEGASSLTDGPRSRGTGAGGAVAFGTAGEPTPNLSTSPQVAAATAAPAAGSASSPLRPHERVRALRRASVTRASIHGWVIRAVERAAGHANARWAGSRHLGMWGIGGAAVLASVVAVVATTRRTPMVASEAPSETGRLEVTAGVGCTVAVDGTPRGALPLEPFAVTPGMHTVTCTRRDGRMIATQVRVTAGETASARFAW